MNDMAKQGAETIHKLAAEVEKLEKRAEGYKRALDLALDKLARYEHREDCRNLAVELVKKGCIGPDDLESEVDKLYQLKVADLEGIRNTVALMRQPHPAWGVLDGSVNAGGSVTEDGAHKTSTDYLEGLVAFLESRG